MSGMKPSERYKALIEQAEELERMAGPGSFGGQTYWNDRVESTRQAIAHAGWRRRDGDRFIWALPPESCDAIHAAFDQEQIDALWKRAAEVLRNRAKGIKSELEAEASQLAELLKEIP